MPTLSDTLGLSMAISGSISAFGSLIVILTYLIFTDLQRLRYVELVFYVSLNDFVASVGVALGPRPSFSIECYYQGFTSNYNYISSVLWTVVISYQVWLIVYRSSVIKNMLGFHCLCWGFTLLISLLPFTTNTYSNPDDESTWCFVGNRSDSPSWGQLFWIIVSFYSIIWSGVIINFIFIVTIIYRLRKMNIIPQLMISTLYKLVPYPIITMICWAVNGSMNIYYASTGIQFDSGSKVWLDVYAFGYVIAISQGFLNAVAFLATNPLVQERWQHLIISIICCNWKDIFNQSNPDMNIDDSIQLRKDVTEATKGSKVENEVDYIDGPTFVESFVARLTETVYPRISEIGVQNIEHNETQVSKQQQDQINPYDLELNSTARESENSIISRWERESSMISDDYDIHNPMQDD